MHTQTLCRNENQQSSGSGGNGNNPNGPNSPREGGNFVFVDHFEDEERKRREKAERIIEREREKEERKKPIDFEKLAKEEREKMNVRANEYRRDFNQKV